MSIQAQTLSILSNSFPSDWTSSLRGWQQAEPKITKPFSSWSNWSTCKLSPVWAENQTSSRNAFLQTTTTKKLQRSQNLSSLYIVLLPGECLKCTSRTQPTHQQPDFFVQPGDLGRSQPQRAKLFWRQPMVSHLWKKTAETDSHGWTPHCCCEVIWRLSFGQQKLPRRRVHEPNIAIIASHRYHRNLFHNAASFYLMPYSGVMVRIFMATIMGV